MSRAALFDWRNIVAALTVTVATVAVGSAIDVRDRTAANTAEIKRIADVQAEKNDRILSDLAAIKKHLGILP